MVEKVPGRFLVAKFVGDLRRREPRNIGVVAWADGTVRSRFLGEAGRSAKLDLRRVPSSFDRKTYEQWIGYWRSASSKRELKFIRDAEIADVSSPRFLDALKSSSLDNFYLDEGGILLDDVDNLDDAVDYLFNELVADRNAEEPRETLEDICSSLVRDSAFAKSPHFREHYPLRVDIGGAKIELQFSYASVNGKPRKLYQRVSLTDRRADLQKTVLSCAFMFEKVAAKLGIPRSDTAAFVNASSVLNGDHAVSEALEVLRSYTRVLDVESNRGEAFKEFLIAARS